MAAFGAFKAGTVRPYERPGDHPPDGVLAHVAEDVGHGHTRRLTPLVTAALAEAGSDATVDRAETDADSNAKYEAHVTKADGTQVTVYVDESFNVVSVEDRPAGGPGDGHRGGRGGRERYAFQVSNSDYKLLQVIKQPGMLRGYRSNP